MEYRKDFYPDAVEDHLSKKLEPLREPVTLWVYVDSNHAGKLANRFYQSIILIYVNNALVNFYIKRQNTFESSSFGSEFVALKISTEMAEELRYKLRTFGVNLGGPSEAYCENKLVVTKSRVTASVLNKAHNSIYYHRVRESQAARKFRVGWIPCEYNLAYLLTKTTMTVNKIHRMVESIFYNKSVVTREKHES